MLKFKYSMIFIIFFYLLKIQTLIVAETFNENLIFIDPKNNERWAFSLEGLVYECDMKNLDPNLPNIENDFENADGSISIKQGETINEDKDGILKSIDHFKNIKNKACHITKKQGTSKSLGNFPQKKETHFGNGIIRENFDPKTTKPEDKNEKSSDMGIVRKIHPESEFLYPKKSSIDNFGVSKCGKLFCVENNILTLVVKDFRDILLHPMFHNDILLTASRRTVHCQFEISKKNVFLIINIFYIQIHDIRNNSKRVIKFHSVFAPMYHVDQNIQIFFDEIQYYKQNFNLEESIRFVYSLTSLNNFFFLNKIISKFEQLSIQKPSTVLLRRFGVFLVVLQIILYLRQIKRNTRITKKIGVKKDITYTQGIFNKRNVEIKSFKKNDARCDNESRIIALLDEPCFLKYTFTDNTSKTTEFIRDICGSSLNEILKSGLMMHITEIESKPNQVSQKSTPTVSMQNNSDSGISINEEDPESIINVSSDLGSMRNSVLVDNEQEISEQNSSFLIDLCRQIAEIFAKLHAKNISVCNVCPENIFLKNSHVFLANFEESLHTMHSNPIFLSSVQNDNEIPNLYILGTENYRSPEIIEYNRFKKQLILEECHKSDVFSLAIIFHQILFGSHQFEINTESIDDNIFHNNYKLKGDAHGPIIDLLHHMVKREPELRPDIFYVLKHPTFWNYEKIYNFYATLSDLLELHGEKSLKVYSRLERNKSKIFHGKWIKKIDGILAEEMKLNRIYNFNNVKGLLRAIRNKGRHYNETSKSIRNLFGSFPDGFINYFTVLFPNLLMVCYYSGKSASHDELFSVFY